MSAAIFINWSTDEVTCIWAHASICSMKYTRIVLTSGNNNNMHDYACQNLHDYTRAMTLNYIFNNLYFVINSLASFYNTYISIMYMHEYIIIFIKWIQIYLWFLQVSAPKLASNIWQILNNFSLDFLKLEIYLHFYIFHKTCLFSQISPKFF